MKRIIRRLRILSLFVAVAAINIHMVIPHDHHLTDSVLFSDGSCPVSHNETSHNTRLPVHCHACNDLTSEKAVNLVVIKLIQCKYFLAGSIINFNEFKLHYTESEQFEIISIYADSESQDITLLRAPPATI